MAPRSVVAAQRAAGRKASGILNLRGGGSASPCADALGFRSVTDWSVENNEVEPPTSSAMLRGLRAWDPSAWERLVNLYGPLVYRWCRRAGLQPADSRDVGQEVFRAVMRGISQFHRDREGDTFRGWLRAITRNKISDCRRGTPPVLTGTRAVEGLGVATSPRDDANDDAAETGIVYRRALELIRGAVEERTWHAFWRVTVEGRPATEVAGELGISPNAVYLAKSHVLRRLREEFADLLEGGMIR